MNNSFDSMELDSMIKTIMPDGKGGIFIVDVPPPKLFEDSVLCQVTHSLISAGTERSMLKNTMGKSKEEIISRGMRMGYSGAGIVQEVKGQDIPLKKGDKVTFYGAPYTSHSEFVVVPRQLVYKVPKNMELTHAAFAGLSAIAMHGFRQGKLALGDICLVAGAGIIGNLLVQQAALAGCKVVVSDCEPSRLELLKKCTKDKNDIICVKPDEVTHAIRELSDNRGADAVYLCMSTKSSEPMEQAIEVVRPGGNIVVVGVLDIHVPREPFFIKEAHITISRAAGPGRYDVGYEKDGVDYPYQYVRWTEGRNLKESLRLIANNKMNVEPLITKILPLEEANEAYSSIMKNKPALGYLIEWN